MNSKLVKSFALGVVVGMAVVATIVAAELAAFQQLQQESFRCPSLLAGPTSYDASGFLMSERIGRTDNMQFVIKPNSNASLEINYLTGVTAQFFYANRTQYFVPVQAWAKLGSNSAAIMNSSEIGLYAVPSTVAVTGNHTLALTYNLTATSSALNGAYVGSFWSTCPPQIVITVGDSFYNGPDLEKRIYF